MRYVAGSITLSAQLCEEARATEAAWSALEWTATHYDEATPEQRADLDRAIAAIDAREDWD